MKYRNVITPSDYGPIIVNRFDNMIGLCISRYGHWEKDEIEMLQWMMSAAYKGEESVEILDVGAYIGFHTLGFARFPFKRVTVHAFEPQRLIFQMLAGTVALNGLDNVHVHNKAVSDRSWDEITYTQIDYSKEANFGALELERVQQHDFDGARVPDLVERVETIRIDDLELRHVRLIKIDVEGMEHKVLLGARETLAKSRPILFMEYEKTDFGMVKSSLKQAGYVAYYSERPNILCLPEEIRDIKIEGAVKVDY